MSNYTKNKVHIYKWRNSNKEKYYEYKRKYRIWIKISLEFMNILLDYKNE
jgi:hypothetical protein